MEQIIYLLVGAALTWAFYFIQRRVERRGTLDSLDRNQKLLLLKQGLEGADVSLEELRKFEARLLGKAETAVRIADRYVTQAERMARQGLDETISQNEMCRQAVARFQRVDARLDQVVIHLRDQLDGSSRSAFEATHLAWLGFRERYAGFIAECYSAGPVRPLIHAVTLESISGAWITELETQLGDERLGDGEEDTFPDGSDDEYAGPRD